MEMKDVMNSVRVAIREQPDSPPLRDLLSISGTRASSVNVPEALTEMLKRDDVSINDGKWRLIAPVARRRLA
jgi:hypothetical protein